MIRSRCLSRSRIPFRSRSASRSGCRGVTLAELALVLLVLGILAGSALPALAERETMRRHRETRALLQAVRASVLGEWLRHGRIACNTLCSPGGVPVPARYAPEGSAIDASGQVVDAWSRPLRLAVAPDGDNLLLCREIGAAGCRARDILADDVRVLILSDGADPSATGAQYANGDGDHRYVLQPYSRLASAPFDDLLTWIGDAELTYWQVRASIAMGLPGESP